MKENEKLVKSYEDAIDCLKKNKPTSGYYMLQESVDMAIKALEEIQKYKEVGTVEECATAVDKQTAKRPDYEGDGYADGYLVYDTWICPNCGKRYEVDYDDYDYCPNCGQKLDWSDEE